jgi:hypothetical protein
MDVKRQAQSNIVAEGITCAYTIRGDPVDQFTDMDINLDVESLLSTDDGSTPAVTYTPGDGTMVPVRGAQWQLRLPREPGGGFD